MPLPTQPVTNAPNPDRLRALLAGHPGIGKTTLASGWFPKTNLHIDLEGGTRFLPGEHFVVRPKTYSEFNQTITDLVAGNHPFKTVTVDTVDELVRMADAEAGLRHGKIAAGLAEFGKGLADRDATITRDFQKLRDQTDLGFILISHAVRVKDDDAGTEVWYPSIHERLRPFFMGMVDFIWFARKNGPARELVCQPNAKFETKSRLPIPDVLPLDALAVHQALVDAVKPAGGEAKAPKAA